MAVRAQELWGPSQVQSVAGLFDFLAYETPADRVGIVRSLRWRFIAAGADDYGVIAIDSGGSGLIDMIRFSAAVLPGEGADGDAVLERSWALNPGTQIWMRVFHSGGFGPTTFRTWGTGAELPT